MIQWGLIKNNLKLMLRSKWILFLMIIMPLLTMGILSSVFDEYLGGDFDVDEIEAWYVLEEQVLPDSIWQVFVGACEENKIYLKEYMNHDYQELLEKDEVDLFILINEKEINLYFTDEKELKAMIIGSVISTFQQETYGNIILAEHLSSNSIQATQENVTKVNATKVAVDPVPSAMDYYGIIYVIYFAWCGMASLAMVISSERKNKIESRLQISPASKFSLYLGKMIPCFLATAIEVTVTLILSILLFDVHWGRMWASAGVLLLMCITISAVGVFLAYLFRSIVSSIMVVYLGLMVMGFLGGSFATYMYGMPESMARWSFIYYLNRTLVEFSTMGKSDYLRDGILYLTAMSFASILIGMLLMRRERQGS